MEIWEISTVHVDFTKKWKTDIKIGRLEPLTLLPPVAQVIIYSYLQEKG